MPDANEVIVEKLRQIIDADQHPPEFTADEMKRLRQLVYAWDWFASGGRFFIKLMGAAIALVAFLGAMIKLLEYIGMWMRGVP